MASIHVRAATAEDWPDAQALVFEYLATTQGEAGRGVPAAIDQLPAVLRTECANLATVYQPPGVLLLAYRDREPIGCVGLKPMGPRGTIEVRRLYVRPTERRGGAGRALMHQAHGHAARHGYTRLVLDVMPTRTRVVDFYRRLGYAEAEPYPTEAPDPMIYLQRPVDP